MIIKYIDTKKKKVGLMDISEYLINSNFSGSLIDIDGVHGLVKNTNEDWIYFIIEGGGIFIIDGKEQEVSEKDLIFIPKNTPYDIKGKLKYFLVCSPEFNGEDDVFLEE